MSRYFCLMLGVLLLTGTALAAPVGPIPPGGWGTDCTNWITYSDPWASNHLIYDPLLGAGGEGFRDCVTEVAVIWPGLEIEMWVEMECVLTWAETQVQIHRASDYAAFYLYFHGTSACNNGQWIITTPPTAVGNLNYLPFVKDMFNRTGPAYGTDIPLTWEYSLGGSAYLPMVEAENPPGVFNRQFEVPLCDQFFTIRILVDQVYHQEDGYYYLGGPGASICPVTPL